MGVREGAQVPGLELTCHRPAALGPAPGRKQRRQHRHGRRDGDGESAPLQIAHPPPHKVVHDKAAHLKSRGHNIRVQMPPSTTKPLQCSVDPWPHDAARQVGHGPADC